MEPTLSMKVLLVGEFGEDARRWRIGALPPKFSWVRQAILVGATPPPFLRSHEAGFRGPSRIGR